jgi:hypothetical protein
MVSVRKYPLSTKFRIYCIENYSTPVILSKEIAAEPKDLYGSVSPQIVEEYFKNAIVHWIYGTITD